MASDTKRGKTKRWTQIRCCYHRGLIAVPAVCTCLISGVRWIFVFFLLLPIAFIFNNKMLNKQAACAHEMHRQMIPLLQTFSVTYSFSLSLSLSLSSDAFVLFIRSVISISSTVRRHNIWAKQVFVYGKWFCVSQIDASCNNFFSLPLIFRIMFDEPVFQRENITESTCKAVKNCAHKMLHTLDVIKMLLCAL